MSKTDRRFDELVEDAVSGPTAGLYGRHALAQGHGPRADGPLPHLRHIKFL